MLNKLILFLLFASLLYANKGVFIKSLNKENQVDVYIINNNLYDITLKYDCNYSNLISSQLFPSIKVVKANSKKKILSFYKSSNKYSLKSSIKYVIGDKNSIHNDEYIYALPYKVGTKQQVTQGFNGYFTHKGNSLYAIDFALKVGTRIYASRGGIVVDIKNGGYKNGGKEYMGDANYIIIKHNDNTYSKYVHLQKGGAKVKIGQKIKRSQFIGFSGNTGYTNGPHLHFVVFKAKSYNKRESIKIKFISKNGIIEEPIRGKYYTSIK